MFGGASAEEAFADDIQYPSVFGWVYLRCVSWCMCGYVGSWHV